MKLSLLILLVIYSFSSCFSQNDLEIDSIAVSFDYNRSEILNETKLVNLLSKKDQSRLVAIRLVGYTDSSGSLARNTRLANERIQSVANFLKRTSLNQVKIEVVNANETSGYRVLPDELNRRVDILFYARNDPPKNQEKLTFELNKPLNLNINFKGGTAVILPVSYDNLEKLKNLMLEDTTLLLKLHGHVCCDNDLELSVKRAYAVMRYLSQNEVDYKRMSAEGFSNSQPLAPDDSETNMALNRRVEAIFYRKE